MTTDKRIIAERLLKIIDDKHETIEDLANELCIPPERMDYLVSGKANLSELTEIMQALRIGACDLIY